MFSSINSGFQISQETLNVSINSGFQISQETLNVSINVEFQIYISGSREFNPTFHDKSSNISSSPFSVISRPYNGPWELIVFLLIVEFFLYNNCIQS